MDPNQFVAHLEVWKELRAETRYFMGQLDIWMWRLFFWTAVLIGLSFLDRVVDERFRYAIVLASVLVMVSPYVLARNDALIHRPAPAIVALENDMAIHGWENHFKPQMRPLTNLLPPLDFIMVIPLTLLFWFATREAGAYLGYVWLQPLFWVGYLGGWAMLVLALSRAATLMQTVK